jgi:hypothetical protein
MVDTKDFAGAQVCIYPFVNAWGKYNPPHEVRDAMRD